MKKLLVFLSFILFALCKKDCGYGQKIVCYDYECKSCYCITKDFTDNYKASKYCGTSNRPLCIEDKIKGFYLKCYLPVHNDFKTLN